MLAGEHFSDSFDTSYIVNDTIKNLQILRFEKIIHTKGQKDERLISSYYSNELLIKLKEEQNSGSLRTILNTYNKQHDVKLKIIDSISNTNIFLVRTNSSEIFTIQNLKEVFNPICEYIEPNFLYYNQSNQFLVRFDIDQWSLQNRGSDYRAGGKYDADIDALEALSIIKWGREIKYPVIVAVIDGGIDKTHPALKNSLWINAGEVPNNGKDDDGNGLIDDVNGWNFGSSNKDITDYTGHGTHVSGIIAARPEVHSFTGIAPDAKILVAKSSDSDIHSTLSISKAVYYAIGKNCHVINMSLGSYDYSQTLANAVSTAIDNNINIVAAAGNDGKDLDLTPFYPGALPKVICVASTDKFDNISSFSNYQAGIYRVPIVRIAAPGEAILSSVPGGIYAYKNGTSMAAPHVAGVVALLKSRYPTDDIISIYKRLNDGADILPQLSQKVLGNKRLNAYRPLVQPKEEVNQNGIAYRNQIVNGQERGQRYPYANFGDPGIDGKTLESAFKIASMKQLLNLRDEDVDKHFILMNNIDWNELLPNEKMMIDKTFTGKLYGQGFSIKNISYKGGGTFGLFKKIGKGGSVSNLRLTGVEIDGVSFLGALASQIDQAIINFVQIEGNIKSSFQFAGGLAGAVNTSTISNFFFEGSVYATRQAGGLTGQCQNNVIRNTHIQGIISVENSHGGGISGLIRKCKLDEINCNVMVKGKKYLGGIAADMRESEIKDSFIEGNINANEHSAGGLAGYVTESVVKNCYAISFTKPVKDGGGLLGTGNNFQVRKSYFSSFQNDNGVGGTPKLPAELQSTETFKEWDPGRWVLKPNFSPALLHNPRSILSLQ